MTAYSDLKAQADQRWDKLVAGGTPWIRVGTAMCGHAAGAVEVVDALKAALAERNIETAIDEVGCLGLCFAEPLVDILKPGMPRLFFKNVSPADIPALVDGYLLGARGPGG